MVHSQLFMKSYNNSGSVIFTEAVDTVSLHEPHEWQAEDSIFETLETSMKKISIPEIWSVNSNILKSLLRGRDSPVELLFKYKLYAMLTMRGSSMKCDTLWMGDEYSIIKWKIYHGWRPLVELIH